MSELTSELPPALPNTPHHHSLISSTSPLYLLCVFVHCWSTTLSNHAILWLLLLHHVTHIPTNFHQHQTSSTQVTEHSYSLGLTTPLSLFEQSLISGSPSDPFHSELCGYLKHMWTHHFTKLCPQHISCLLTNTHSLLSRFSDTYLVIGLTDHC